VDAHRRPGPADPEFDPAPAAPVRLRDFDPTEHHRLVVNPFLAVLALMVWCRAAGWLLWHGPFPPLAVASVALLALVPRAIQYHCLDCGQTGSYSRRDRHACPAVFARWNERKRAWFPIPSASLQLTLWAYAIGSVALLLALSGDRPGGR
jgi:hypothetical protein